MLKKYTLLLTLAHAQTNPAVTKPVIPVASPPLGDTGMNKMSNHPEYARELAAHLKVDFID